VLRLLGRSLTTPPPKGTPPKNKNKPPPPRGRYPKPKQPAPGPNPPGSPDAPETSEKRPPGGGEGALWAMLHAVVLVRISSREETTTDKETERGSVRRAGPVPIAQTRARQPACAGTQTATGASWPRGTK